MFFYFSKLPIGVEYYIIKGLERSTKNMKSSIVVIVCFGLVLSSAAPGPGKFYYYFCSLTYDNFGNCHILSVSFFSTGMKIDVNFNRFHYLNAILSVVTFASFYFKNWRVFFPNETTPNIVYFWMEGCVFIIIDREVSMPKSELKLDVAHIWSNLPVRYPIELFKRRVSV